MHTPQTDYVQFWLVMAFGTACGTAILVMLGLFILIWLVCGLIVIGGMRKRTVSRVLFALSVGPLLLRNRGFSV